MRPHHRVARLELSGEKAVMGSCDDAVYIQFHGQPDATYMSVEEAKMLISGLKVAITKAQGDR